MVSKLEQMAYGHATAIFISSSGDFEGTWYERYEFLADHTGGGEDDDILDGWIPWEPFEALSWRNIVELIYNEADEILALLEDALEHAKRGIVTSVIDGSLGGVAQLDMERMVEIGAAK